MVELYQTRLHDLPLEVYQFSWVSDDQVVVGLRHVMEPTEGFENGGEVVLWDIVEQQALRRFETEQTIHKPYQPEPDEIIYQFDVSRWGMFYDKSEDEFLVRYFESDEPFS